METIKKGEIVKILPRDAWFDGSSVCEDFVFRATQDTDKGELENKVLNKFLTELARNTGDVSVPDILEYLCEGSGCFELVQEDKAIYVAFPEAHKGSFIEIR